jgi:hypothetical protein
MRELSFRPRRRQTLQSTDKPLLNNDIGEDNTAISVNALLSNPSGNSNTAYGAFALSANTGTGNIALEIHAGGQFTTGNNNIDIGDPGNAGESNRIRIGGQGAQTSHIYSWYRWRDVAGSNGQLGVSASSQRFKKRLNRWTEPAKRSWHGSRSNAVRTTHSTRRYGPIIQSFSTLLSR